MVIRPGAGGADALKILDAPGAFADARACLLAQAEIADAPAYLVLEGAGGLLAAAGGRLTARDAITLAGRQFSAADIADARACLDRAAPGAADDPGAARAAVRAALPLAVVRPPVIPPGLMPVFARAWRRRPGLRTAIRTALHVKRVRAARTRSQLIAALCEMGESAEWRGRDLCEEFADWVEDLPGGPSRGGWTADVIAAARLARGRKGATS